MTLRRHRFRLLACAIALALSAAATSAGAEDLRERARSHFDRATKLLAEEKYAEALKELEAAQTLHPHPSVLFNIGMVHASLGDPLAAAAALEQYLAEAGNTVSEDRRAETQRTLDALSARLATLTLDVEPAGARVKLDGKLIATAPISGPVRVMAGHHVVVVQHPGYRDEQQALDLRGRTAARLQFRLASVDRMSVEVDCALPDTDVLVDEAAVGRTPMRSVTLPLGAHRIEFRRSGYRPSRHSVLAARGASGQVRCDLVPDPRHAQSRIELVGAAKNGRAWVDGRPLPVGGRLPAGRHHVKLSAPRHKDWEREVDLPHGRTLALGHELEPDDSLLRARERQRTWAYALGANGMALMLVAGGVFLWNTDRYGDWRDRQDSLDGDWGRYPVAQDMVKRQTENDELRESIQNFDRVSVGFAVGGAALVSAGAILYLTGEDPDRAPSVAVAPSSASVNWRVRF
ncbi:MAG: PEGA domain-containing protein [Polyangiaceae bacterium]|nr:PEGA domain-containing protein [Polyangiaceae bacterium]